MPKVSLPRLMTRQDVEDCCRGEKYFATDCIRLLLSLRKTKKHKVVAAEVAVADAMRKWRDLM